MIKIIDDWYCTVSGSPICYTVKRGKGIVDKNGRCKDKEYGYFTSLQNAIKCVRDEICAETFANGVHPLSDAIRTIVETEAKLESSLRAAFK